MDNIVFRDTGEVELQSLLRGLKAGTIQHQYDDQVDGIVLAINAGEHCKLMLGVEYPPDGAAEPDPIKYIPGTDIPATILAQLVEDQRLEVWNKDRNGVQWYKVAQSEVHSA